jgi:signal transduction histidine kinase
VEIRTDFQESTPSILVDPEQVKQAILNLIQNGLDAIPEGGTLSVATGMAEGKAFIRVSDTGSGLSPNARENLFRPFLTTKAKGTGLGLAISQRLITQNGGTVALVENGPPMTTFEIGFPYDDPGANLPNGPSR